MAITSSNSSAPSFHRLKLGMVGGGQGAFIGAVHRYAARLDDRYQLVAGALSSDPERALASAEELGIDPQRSGATGTLRILWCGSATHSAWSGRARDGAFSGW